MYVWCVSFNINITSQHFQVFNQAALVGNMCKYISVEAKTHSSVIVEQTVRKRVGDHNDVAQCFTSFIENNLKWKYTVHT